MTTTNSQAITINYPDKDDLIKMLQAEEQIRMSAEYLKMCDAVKNEPNGWLRISEQIQYNIAKQFGYVRSIEQDLAVNRMRRAQYLYPNEPLFKTISVYVRNNLAREGDFKVGNLVPNLTIFNENLKQIQLYDTLNKTKLNMLIASSHT